MAYADEPNNLDFRTLKKLDEVPIKQQTRYINKWCTQIQNKMLLQRKQKTSKK